MSLRTQLTLFTSLLVAAAVVIVSLVAYFAAENRLRGEIDDTLRARLATVGNAETLPQPGGGPGDSGGGSHDRADPFADTDSFFQVIDNTGKVIGAPNTQDVQLPITSGDIAVASGTHSAFLHDETVNGLHMRVITSPGRSGQAVQIGRSLAEVDASLSGLRNILLVVSGSGIALAAALGLIVANRSLRPVGRLTAAAEHVADTQDLGAKIAVGRNDEIGRLATSFNAMLNALNESRQQQRQLVTDASHELRTPLTSLRTNIEVLARDDDLPEFERRQLLHDATFELEELTKLVSEMVELASDTRAERREFEDVRLDRLAASVVARARRRTAVRIELHADPTLVSGNHHLLERAASNLVDNAIKWSKADGAIEVTVSDGVFAVRDHGAGIDTNDVPHVFDRFYRAESARSRPGSGLGLAIVKQIVDAHGGDAWVEAAPGGGAIAAFRIPSLAFDALPTAASTRDGRIQ